MTNNNYISMPCGGNGICGKCKVKILKGDIPENKRDKQFLTSEELKQGYRIACGHTFPADTEFISASENFNAVSDYTANPPIKPIKANNLNHAIIIDVGTTTLCFRLIDNTGVPIKTITFSNSQRAFGADVLSRISKSAFGGFSQLCGILKNDLKKGITELLKDFKDIIPQNIYIAGNTTMTYFLRNMDCRGLGTYPFENNAKDTFSQNSLEFFGKNFPFSAQITILPCIHAFVGGDIVSGAYFLNMDKENNSLFIDIGTNGEIVLNSKGKLYVSSVAAGPAFEGGSISCGVGGINGAINSIHLKDNSFEYTTINNFPPIGICGSALIDLTAELLENKIIDKTGLLSDKYFSSGVKIADKIFLTQNDIRQIQLAKSAIISGIQCILDYAGTTAPEIEKIFIGGGFGFYLNIENAFKIKMLPKNFSEKISLCGNTSLGGLSKIHTSEKNDYEKFITKTVSVNLAETETFQKYFIDNLNF